jgi:hypothetical protein
LAQTKNWSTRFTEGDWTCNEQLRTGRPRHMLGTERSQFLQEFLFATASQPAYHFNESKHIIKAILECELGLPKFSRRWLPRYLSDPQKVDRMRKARYILDVLQEQTDKSVNCIITGDESCFFCRYHSDHMLASWWESVIPRQKQTIASRNVMLTIFSAKRVWSVWMSSHMIRDTPKNIWSIIFDLTLWMGRGEFGAEIGRDDFSSIWTIPCAITVGWLPKKSQMRSLDDFPTQLILQI